MASKTIRFESVVSALDGNVDTSQAQAILAKIQEEEKKRKAEEDADKPPRQKKQFCIVLADHGNLPEDIIGWVVQIPEDSAPQSVTERIPKAAAEFNTTKKGRRMPVLSVGEALEVIPARLFKEVGIAVKTKQPVLAVPLVNDITAVVKAEIHKAKDL